MGNKNWNYRQGGVGLAVDLVVGKLVDAGEGQAIEVGVAVGLPLLPVADLRRR